MAKIQRGTPNWYRRNLILPLETNHGPHEVEIIDTLYAWHGGQDSAVYSLASTGDHDYVSASMVERAMAELERDLSRTPTNEDASELIAVLGELNVMLAHPEEHTSKHATGEDEDSGYDDYGLRIDEIGHPRSNPENTTTSRDAALAARLARGEN